MAKPVEEPKEEIPEDIITQVYRERGELIDGHSKSEQFKEMFEEVYLMVITQNENEVNEEVEA